MAKGRLPEAIMISKHLFYNGKLIAVNICNKKPVVQRTLPGAGNLSLKELQAPLFLGKTAG
jgi:hypothetical protein